MLIALTLSGHAKAMSDEALFKQAKQDYSNKNAQALSDDLNQLKNQQYLLAPYAEYWLMLLKLEQARDEEVQNFLAQYGHMPFSDRLRGEWLKKLAKQKNWPAFFDELPYFNGEDKAVQCYALLGHQQLKDLDVSAQAKAMWLSSADLPGACTALFDAMQKSGALSQDDIWSRVRLALLDGNLALAKNILSRIANLDPAALKLFDRADLSPQLLLEKRAASFKSRLGVELNLYALDRLARTKLDVAILLYDKLQGQFDADERAVGWGRIAYHAARKHDSMALHYYGQAEGVTLNAEQLAWKTRAALRAQDWPVVLQSIALMSSKQADEGAWRYWKARAVKETAAKSAEQTALAHALFRKLATERHYYAWLAAEELDSVMASPALDYQVSEQELSLLANQPAIKRAVEFQRIGMRWESKVEWLSATRNFDDKQLLAAAEFALRQKWYDLTINTADNTRITHNFSLRYPTPYRDLFRNYAKDAGLDEAWVYGIARQESHFMHFAKSGVGASGLMQVMPTTAKWVAQRMGLNDYSHTMLHDLHTNVEFGTHYMRYTLDLMAGQAVMATAGYNAGPSRAKAWMATEPMEAAIYIECIPYPETRLYVQKVMANAQIYAPRLLAENSSIKIQSLKARLGKIPGRAKLEQPTLAESDSD
ncbi:MAG: lytic transglycosylase domain-containing protein [Methylotenera sp.]|nr:lytic transglycosylase domain-containing protein [Methylotenera sp.]